MFSIVEAVKLTAHYITYTVNVLYCARLVMLISVWNDCTCVRLLMSPDCPDHPCNDRTTSRTNAIHAKHAVVLKLYTQFPSFN